MQRRITVPVGGHIQWHITSVCPNRCIHCYMYGADATKVSRNDLSIAQIYLVKHTVNNELIAKKFFHQYINQLIKLGNSSSIYKIILPHDFDCLHRISSEIAKRSCSPTDI